MTDAYINEAHKYLLHGGNFDGIRFTNSVHLTHHKGLSYSHDNGDLLPLLYYPKGDRLFRQVIHS
jgi:hypothetical protein